MTQQRWLRILPVALIMYTISYVDRTNISLALDPNISSLMHDLSMDDRMKGELAGIFCRVHSAADSRRLFRVALERAEIDQPVPDGLGNFRHRLRVFKNVRTICDDAVLSGSG